MAHSPEDVHTREAQVGVLVTNIGSPEAPTPPAVRRYLAEFLGDQRIVELPRWLWWPILHGVLLNIRPARSARLYRHIWTAEGAPLVAIARAQAAGLQARLADRLGAPVAVAVGMRYGRPSIAEGLHRLAAANARRVLVFPLFPQYSATTTATTLDAVFAALQRWRWMPELRTLQHYHDHPAYLDALTLSIREHWAAHGRPTRLLFSFHGIPESYFLKGDPYYCECQKTARLAAERLGLGEAEWAVSFQSRFGPARWLQPYTDHTLEAWGREGLSGVHVVCAGFSADCLETLDEIGRENRLLFEAAGGRGFSYIPALNTRPEHLEALAEIALPHLQGWGRAAPTHPQLLTAVAEHRRRVATKRAGPYRPAHENDAGDAVTRGGGGRHSQ